MITRLIVLSGHVATGKSTLAQELSKRNGFVVRKSRDWLNRRSRKKTTLNRKELQKTGDRFDKKTKGRWIVQELMKDLPALENDTVIIDSARTKDQIENLRRSFGHKLVHIHLTAPKKVLIKRFLERGKQDGQESDSYEEILKNKTEQQVDTLKQIADIVIDIDRCTPQDVLIRAVCHLRLCNINSTSYVDVLIGGQYGSEGKGQIASYLAKEYDLLVRVGGPNAGHKVYMDPKPHTYHLLPSGTCNSQANLLLGPGTVIKLNTLLREISDFEVDAERLYIDHHAIIIEDEDKKAESKLEKAIGSTASGVGKATSRRIMDRAPPLPTFAKDVPELKPYLCEAYEVLEAAYSQNQRILLEGTQGTGLSLYHGDYPYVTSRDTTVAGCLAEAGIPPSRVRKVIMVCRTYPIRVESPEGSTSGPMSIEIDWQDVSNRSGIPVEVLREQERTSTTDRERRVSEFDWILLHKATMLNGPTDIALTFADYLTEKNKQAMRFEQLDPGTISFIQEVERVSGARVSLIAKDFSIRPIIDRRLW